MTALQIVREAEAAGVTLSALGDKIILRGPEPLAKRFQRAVGACPADVAAVLQEWNGYCASDAVSAAIQLLQQPTMEATHPASGGSLSFRVPEL